MSDHNSGPYEEVVRFREAERTKTLASINELIEDAKKRAKSRHTLSRERTKWTSVAGKLMWYKDQILRSMGVEAVHKEALALKLRISEMEKRRANQPTRTSQ